MLITWSVKPYPLDSAFPALNSCKTPSGSHFLRETTRLEQGLPIEVRVSVRPKGISQFPLS